MNNNEDVIIKLKKESLVRCGSLFTIEKTSLESKATSLTSSTMKSVDEKLGIVLGI